MNSFATAEEALEMLAKECPQLLVSDLGLPGIGGLEFLRRVREIEARDNLAPVKAIALTALASKSDREAVRDNGYDGFLSKPVAPEELISTIRRVYDLRAS